MTLIDEALYARRVRVLVIAGLLVGCEQARSPAQPPDPPPGPTRIAFDAAPPDMTIAVDAERRTVEPLDELREIANILDPKMGGIVDAAKLAKMTHPPSPDWDPTHVWLLEFRQDGKKIAVFGQAQADVDIVQLARRLAVDALFEDVEPVSGERLNDGTWKFEVDLISPGADPATKRLDTKMPPRRS